MIRERARRRRDRAVVVVEAMAALTLVDLILENMTSTMDKIVKFYNREN